MEQHQPAHQARHAPPGPRSSPNSTLLLVLGGAAVLAGLIGPQLPYYTTSSGSHFSIASFHALCSSGIGALAQASSASAVSNCDQAGLLSSAGWLAVVAGVVLLAAGGLIWHRGRP
jgi:hypothetical protein